jgi:hypothetical protein
MVTPDRFGQTVSVSGSPANGRPEPGDLFVRSCSWLSEAAVDQFLVTITLQGAFRTIQSETEPRNTRFSPPRPLEPTTIA